MLAVEAQNINFIKLKPFAFDVLVPRLLIMINFVLELFCHIASCVSEKSSDVTLKASCQHNDFRLKAKKIFLSLISR